MHNGLYPRSDLNRFYVLREDGGRELANVEDTVILAKISLEKPIKESHESLLGATRNDFENPVTETVKRWRKISKMKI